MLELVLGMSWSAAMLGTSGLTVAMLVRHARHSIRDIDRVRYVPFVSRFIGKEESVDADECLLGETTKKTC